MILPAAGVFESFNARALEPAQVAKTFVPPDQFELLARRAHTLVIGPRGSGKTTLLKMLQQEALESWQHPDAERFRQSIDYTGVFIGTDVSWSSQLDALADGFLDADHRELIRGAAFTTHILRAFVSAMNYRLHGPTAVTFVPHRRLTLSAESEYSVVKELSGAWGLDPLIPTLSALKRSLSTRLLNLREIVKTEKLLPAAGRPERLASHNDLMSGFIESLALAADVFEDASGEGRTRWALLFDELELAPDHFTRVLFQSLRSVDDRFLFKLSLSPFSGDFLADRGPTSATEGNDYDVITLFYAEKEDSYKFCGKLLSSMLADRGLPNVPPDDLFGYSEFDTAPEEWRNQGTAYRLNSRLQNRFVRLAGKDASFRSYLESKKIDPANLQEVKGAARASDIRKVTSIVAVRDEFLGAKELQRSRKNPELYSGSKVIFAAAEGNPRWFIGIVSRLFKTMPTGQLTIRKARQSRELKRAAQRFRAMLRTIPCPPVTGISSSRGILSLIDPVGIYIHSAAIREPFNPDPVGTFIVDANAPEDLQQSLGLALNAGAIVYVPDDKSELLLTTLRGRRFRLTYLLSPYYKIPNRLGRPLSLGSILNSKPSATLFDVSEDLNEQ